MQKILEDRKLIVGITAVLLSISIGSAIRLLTDSPKATPDVSEPTFESTLESRLAPLSASLAAVAGDLQSGESMLLQSTPTQSRVAEISAGRADPFASITQPPSTSIPSAQPTVTRNSPAASVQSVSNQPGDRVPLIPVAATQSLPPLPSLPTVSLEPTVPNNSQSPVWGASPASLIPFVPAPINLVEAIQVSGVLHIGDRISIIVRESNQSTTRYVGVGAYLANGRVRVKRIDMSGGEEPIVVLEQDGQEYFKRIGDTILASL